MSCLLITAAVLTLKLPAADTFRDIHWQPPFTEVRDLQITQPTVALLTHCSRAFDPLGETADGVQRTMRTMKAAGHPVICLHDRYNPGNPAWMYLYDDWNPTAYVGSDVGNINLPLPQTTHVICLGGYFGQCERSTFTDVIRQWNRQPQKRDLRITQITDATFTVGQYVRWEDPYSKPVRDFLYAKLKPQHPNAVMSVRQMVSLVPPDRVPEVLQRQLPALPSNVNIVMEVFGRTTTVQFVAIEAPALILAYRPSTDFLQFETPIVDTSAPRRWFLRSSSF